MGKPRLKTVGRPETGSDQPAFRPAPKPDLRYRFDLASDLTSMVGNPPRATTRNVPGGTRLYLEYSAGRIGQDQRERADVLESLDESIAKAALGAPHEKILDALANEAGARVEDNGKTPEQVEFKEEYTGIVEEARGGSTKALIQGITQLVLAINRYDTQRNGNGYYRLRRSDSAGRSGEDFLNRLFGQGGFWAGLTGTIITSGDWALLREDGILLLDSKFTIRADDGSLISAVMTGSGDLSAVYGKPGERAYHDWTEGKLPDPPSKNAPLLLPMSVTLRFNAPGPLTNDDLVPATRYRVATRHYWKYVSLGQGLFVGNGSITLGRNADGKPDPETGFAKKLDLKIYELLASTKDTGNG